MRRAELEALALGLLHGPVELVPVSSSGHVAGLPWLLGWEVAGWDGARRKQLEVALHGGTAAALLMLARPVRMRARLLLGATLPPALAGLALERWVEQRLGTPPTLAAGLLAGAAALVLADRSPASRSERDADACDGLALGLAQAVALMPGVSRSGATLAAARARGFDRADASRLSWEVALPVLAGATALKAYRALGLSSCNQARHRSIPRSDPRALAVGAAAAFASTVATARTIGIERREPLWPWAVWRAGLAVAILAVRHNRSG